MRGFLRQLLPPALLPFLKRINGGSVRYLGNYRTWQEAACRCSGYEAAEILERVSAATENVLAGEAAFERDAVCFKEPDYSWPLIASLMWVASRSRGELDVLDFGGSLGSSFLQSRPFLEGLPKVRWNVVDQPAFVQRGRDLFPGGQPAFHTTVEDCLEASHPQVLLLGSVLQYLCNPYDVLASLLLHQFPYVIVDRTPFMVEGQTDRLLVQLVPPSIYPASYPCWFLSLERLLCHFQRYRIVAQLPCTDKTMVAGGEFRGFIFASEPAGEAEA